MHKAKHLMYSSYTQMKQRTEMAYQAKIILNHIDIRE